LCLFQPFSVAALISYIPKPSSDQTTLTNALSGAAARKRMFMLRDVDIAGFNDHVNSLAYYARPFTIEHLQTYHRLSLAFSDAALNAGTKMPVLGSFGLRTTRKGHDAIRIHHCAVLTSYRLTYTAQLPSVIMVCANLYTLFACTLCAT
jgi:hypothetical protein